MNRIASVLMLEVSALIVGGLAAALSGLLNGGLSQAPKDFVMMFIIYHIVILMPAFLPKRSRKKL